METDALDGTNRKRQTARVVNLGLAANAVLAAFKILFGIFGNSKALLADGVNSVSDVVYLIFVKLLVRFSNKPADEEHPYGHQQMETIAAVIIGAFVITTGIAIFWDAINAVFDVLSGFESNQPVQIFTLIVAGSTIVIKIFLMLNARWVSRKTNNIAVQALARDHRNDIFASSGAALGIVMSLLGFGWLDPVAGALVAVIIVKTGIDILQESAAELMDKVPGKELEKSIRDSVAFISEVRIIENIHVHKFGPYYVINITVGIDGAMNIFQADRITDLIEERLAKDIALLRRVYIHCHPAKMEAYGST